MTWKKYYLSNTIPLLATRTSNVFLATTSIVSAVCNDANNFYMVTPGLGIRVSVGVLGVDVVSNMQQPYIRIDYST